MKKFVHSHFNISKKLALKYFYYFIIVSLIILFWFLRNNQVANMISRQQQQVSQMIISTINEQAKLDLLLPDVVFINIDPIIKKQLKDSISKQIASALIKKYIVNQKESPNDLNFQHFLIFPTSEDKNNNYTITKPQLEEFKNHIQFLTLQIDKAVTATKDEINKEIERINTWVTIWIGILSIFGIIIPLFYNYKNNEDLKTIKIYAKAAQTKAGWANLKAHEVQSTVFDIKSEIEKVKDIPAELKELKKSFVDIEDNVIKTKFNAEQAILNTELVLVKLDKIEKIVSTLNDISKIKDIDSQFLLYNTRPFETLHLYLRDIYNNLTNCIDIFDKPIIKDVFRQLALRLYLIAPSSFILPANFELLNKFSSDVSNLLIDQITSEKYIDFLKLLETLNNELED